MTVPVFLDTSQLRFYRNAPDNYAHFVLGNLFEVFVALHEAQLLDADLELVHNNPLPAFGAMYAVFSARPARIATQSPDGARVLTLSESVDWTTLEAQRDLAHYLPLFQQHVWKHVLAQPPSAADTVTLISRRNLASGNRYVINEGPLIRVLERACQAAGVQLQVVDFAELSFAEQVALMARSRVLIGIHGAGLVNTLFLPPTAAVVELLPDARFVALFFRFMGMAKGNGWVRVDPSWSVPSLYNLLLACIRSGHSRANRFYRDRNAAYEPGSIERALSLALEAGSGALADVKLEPAERAPGRRLRLVGAHQRFILALGAALIATPFLNALVAFWVCVPLLVALAFFT
jgi:hypothetical protein